MLGRNGHHRWQRHPEYERTPEVLRLQEKAMDDHYSEALRYAFVRCSDPRADIYEVVEGSYAELVAGWGRWKDDPRTHLLDLVRHNAGQAVRDLKSRSWDPEYWRMPDYLRLFGAVASAAERATLKAIMNLQTEERRIYEARRVYSWPVAQTARRIGINQNSVGSTTTRAERKIDQTEGASAETAKAFFDHHML